MDIIRTLQGLILWIALFFLGRLPIILLGFITIPIAYLFRNGNHFPKWAWIWDNKEDGIYGAYWFTKGITDFKTCYRWSAIRNPANNMRFLKPFSILHGDVAESIIIGDHKLPTPRLSREIGRAVWHLTLVRVGWLWYVSFWYIKAKSYNKHFRIRLGWKCTPKWIKGKDLNNINKYSGITFQLMPDRDG